VYSSLDVWMQVMAESEIIELPENARRDGEQLRRVKAEAERLAHLSELDFSCHDRSGPSPKGHG
jgi:hypothetical protein